MFNYEHSVKGNIDLQKLWNLYEDVCRWSDWDIDVENVKLNGKFLAGTLGEMLMKNGQNLPFRIEEVTNLNCFTTSSSFGSIKVTFGHEITANNDGSNTITHTITIGGGNENQMEGMGKSISANVPENMNRLISLSK